MVLFQNFLINNFTFRALLIVTKFVFYDLLTIDFFFQVQVIFFLVNRFPFVCFLKKFKFIQF